MDLQSNANTWLATQFVDELAAAGLAAVCIAPGSRSTPLTLAFAACRRIKIYRHLDERSAAFFTLGLALVQRRPVALVCTSGTAAANFLPAVIEASHAEAPLLVLTADRPPELRDSGSNQTIDQHRLFGTAVRWFAELPAPDRAADDLIGRQVRSVAARAYDLAAADPAGPVHINFPFRKPLEPAPDSTDQQHRAGDQKAVSGPHARILTGTRTLSNEQLALIAQRIAGRTQGFIVCGPHGDLAGAESELVDLSNRTGFPILAEALSGPRFGQHVKLGAVAGSYDLWLDDLEADWSALTVLRFGAAPTSRSLARLLERVSPENHIHVRSGGRWSDDAFTTGLFVRAEAAELVHGLAAGPAPAPAGANSGWAERIREIERAAWQSIDDELEAVAFFDGAAVARILRSAPDHSVIFAGNSLPVRLVERFARPSGRTVSIYGNRGASGIDGNVSTALGIAAASGRPLIAIVGDITFYHDMNGLLAVKQHDLEDVTFVVLNNNGGGIFRRLPVASLNPPFEDLFVMPHGLTFEAAAAQYGLDYARVAGSMELEAALARMDNVGSNGRSAPRPRLIEIQTIGEADKLALDEMDRRVRSRLSTQFDRLSATVRNTSPTGD